MYRRLWIYILLLCAIFVTACNGKENTEEQTEMSVIPVEVADVKQGNLIVKRAVFGNTAPAEQSPVLINEPSEIKSLNVTNGDMVDEDDLLATLGTARGDQNIYAPASGEVAKLKAEEGALQSNEEPLLVIINTENLHMTFQVTGTVQKLFEKDETTTIYINDHKYKGKVLSVDSLPNETGQYTLKVEMANEDNILPGTAVKLEIAETKVKDTILLPTESVVTETDDTFVYIKDGDYAKKVKIHVVETQSDQTAVKGDLKEGDQVIVKGQFTLSDGADIQVKEGKQ